jgi:hypothetical protein
MKRSAEGEAQVAGDENECPVCFHPMQARTVARPFGCSHPLCRACDRRMFQGHDDRCPICRAERTDQSHASSGLRPPGIPVHQRRDEPEGAFAFVNRGGLGLGIFPDDDEGGVHYTSFVAAPGGDDPFNSLEEMLNGVVASSGISRARIGRGTRVAAAEFAPADIVRRLRNMSESHSADVAANLQAAMNAITDDPGIAAAMEGLTNPSGVPLGTFLDRVQMRGATSAAGRGRGLAQAGRQGSRTSFARRRQALASGDQ